jgi:predicted GNAT family acetyltransferase
MTFEYLDDKIFSVSDGKVIAEIYFPHRDEKRVNITHVFVDESLRGQGIASNLMKLAYDYIKSKGWMIVAKCPSAIEWFKKHPDYQDIVINVKTKPSL